MRSFVFIIVIASATVTFAGRDVAFLGLSGDHAPAIEKTYDRLLREHLSVMPNLSSADYITTQKFAKHIDFSSYPTVSSSLVEHLDRLATDTTVLVWGTVRKYKVSAVRKQLIRAAIKAELVIGLTVYSLANRTYAYAGEVHAEIVQSKGLVLFMPVAKSVHITALDRTEILEKVLNQAVFETSDLLSAIVASENSKEDSGISTKVNKYEVPKLSEVFNVPSVEAPSVQDTLKNDSTAAVKELKTDAKPDSTKETEQKPGEKK